MIDYTIQIDLSGGNNPDGYFDIGVIQLGSMDSEYVDGNYRVERRGFGEIEVKNEPYYYYKLGGDRYNLFDIISSVSPSQEIHLKFTSAYETLYSYFGIIDCKLDADNNKIIIKNYILDQYTDLLESRETEVKLFDETNQIVNGNFKEWENENPTGWVQNSQKYLQLERSYKESFSLLKISDRVYVNEEMITDKGYWDASTNTPNLDEIVSPQNGDWYQCTVEGEYTNIYGTWLFPIGLWISYNSVYQAWMPVTGEVPELAIGGKWHPVFPELPIQVWQIITNILPDKQLSLDLIYQFTGTTSRRKKLPIDILFTDSATSDVYRLLKTGVWTKELSGTDKIFYENAAISVSIDQVSSSSIHRFKLYVDKTPGAGQVQFIIYRPYDISGITNTWDENYALLIGEIELATSAIELKTIKIQLNGENIITKNEDAEEITWADRKPMANFYSTKLDYEKTLDSFFDGNGMPITSELIMSDDNMVQIQDVIQFFQDQSSKSYKFELSAITIFRCEYIAHKERRFRAICEFSREEIYWPIKYDENNELVPPAADSGWYNTNIKEEGNNDRFLWIRTPFNLPVDALTWVKSGIDSGGGVLRNHTNGFGYYDSITSKKQYPTTSDRSVEIANAIDFKEIFTKVYRETHLTLRGKNVYSNFLWNDALSVQETADVYLNNSSDTNYVTMSDDLDNVEPPNELNKILAVHTYEFSTVPTTDKEKTILKLSFKDLMSDFIAHFPQCYWFVDANKDLHIEHIKYYDRVNKAKDLTIPQYNYLGNYNSWEYIKDKLFSIEEYEFKNSGNIDFINSEVTFAKIVSNKRGQESKINISGKVISTDVQFCIENRDSLDNGIVLLDYGTVDDENICRFGIGQNTKNIIINGSLSIASLLEKYATYEGSWSEGKINDKGFGSNNDGFYNYYATKHIRQGDEITIKGVFLDKIILTNLGLGIINKREVDYENEVTRVSAVYRYLDPFPVYGLGNDEPVEEETSPVIEVSILSIFGITDISAIVKCKISSGYEYALTKGVVWALDTLPTIDDSFTVDSGIFSLYASIITGLDPLNRYYVRAFVNTEWGYIYSDELTFDPLN
jgi:hypothetical protein